MSMNPQICWELLAIIFLVRSFYPFQQMYFEIVFQAHLMFFLWNLRVLCKLKPFLDKMGTGYFTSESNAIGDAGLYSLKRTVSRQPMTDQRQFIRVYPTPSSDRIYFDNLVFNIVTLTSPLGRVVEKSNYTSSLNVSHLEPGFYFITFYDENLRVIFKQILLRQ